MTRLRRPSLFLLSVALVGLLVGPAGASSSSVGATDPALAQPAEPVWSLVETRVWSKSENPGDSAMVSNVTATGRGGEMTVTLRDHVCDGLVRARLTWWFDNDVSQLHRLDSFWVNLGGQLLEETGTCKGWMAPNATFSTAGECSPATWASPAEAPPALRAHRQDRR